MAGVGGGEKEPWERSLRGHKRMLRGMQRALVDTRMELRFAAGVPHSRPQRLQGMGVGAKLWGWEWETLGMGVGAKR